jgi:ribosomal protein S27E
MVTAKKCPECGSSHLIYDEARSEVVVEIVVFWLKKRW